MMAPLLDAGFDAISCAIADLGTRRDDGVVVYSVDDVVASDDQGLLGALDREISAGRVELGVPARAMFDMLIKLAATDSVILEARAAAAISMLRDLDVETRVLKGAAVAHLDYPDPAWRQFADVDLLVRGSDIGTAVKAFAEHGFERHFAEPFDGFDEWIGKGVALEDAAHTVFDLHRTLALGYYGTRLPIETFWRDPDRFEVAGVEMTALPISGRFVHCALHLALTPRPRIANGLDLALIAPRVDSDEVLTVVTDWGCADPLARALVLAQQWLGDSWIPPGLAEWAARHRPTITDRLAMAAFSGPFAGTRLRSMTAVLGLPSGRLKRAAIRGAITRGHHERE